MYLLLRLCQCVSAVVPPLVHDSTTATLQHALQRLLHLLHSSTLRRVYQINHLGLQPLHLLGHHLFGCTRETTNALLKCCIAHIDQRLRVESSELSHVDLATTISVYLGKCSHALLLIP